MELKGVDERGLKARGGRRDVPGEVLKDRRSPRQRGRMGTSVHTLPVPTATSAIPRSPTAETSTLHAEPATPPDSWLNLFPPPGFFASTPHAYSMICFAGTWPSRTSTSSGLKWSCVATAPLSAAD